MTERARDIPQPANRQDEQRLRADPERDAQRDAAPERTALPGEPHRGQMRRHQQQIGRDGNHRRRKIENQEEPCQRGRPEAFALRPHVARETIRGPARQPRVERIEQTQRPAAARARKADGTSPQAAACRSRCRDKSSCRTASAARWRAAERRLPIGFRHGTGAMRREGEPRPKRRVGGARF